MSWFRSNGEVPGAMNLPEEAILKRELDMRAVYKGEYGLHVMTSNLVSLSFFRETLTDEEVNLCNMAKRQLSYMGIWVPGNEESITNALLGLQRPIKE